MPGLPRRLRPAGQCGVPIIAGQNRAYLALALRALREGQRGGGNAEIMQPFAQGLTDAQIDELAGFFAGLRNLR